MPWLEVAFYAARSKVYLSQTIIALNTDEDIPVDNSLVSFGYNLIGNDGNGRLTVHETDLLNIDPNLGIWQGDFYPLTETSPALNTIPVNVCSSQTDQLNRERPQGSACDIGAIEMVGGNRRDYGCRCDTRRRYVVCGV